MNLKPEELAVGKENYHDALGVNRRDFLKGVVAAGAVSGAGLGAMYFGYSKVKDPVRVGVIGTGDEGSVLIGALNPEYVDVVAISDIRPYNVHRAFHGDHASPAALDARQGLMSVYDWKTEDEAKKHVKVYTDYKELLADPNVEAVICALPLFIHKQVAMDAMAAGKHVLTEKLMAHTVMQCKEMGRMAEEQDLYLATGHQRHYSVLYDNAVNLIQWGVLGELHHIRAQWHRGNLPGGDSWQQPIPGGEKLADGEIQDEIKDRMNAFKKRADSESDPVRRAQYKAMYAQYAAWNEDRNIDASKYGYNDFNIRNRQGGERQISALEELCRWRLWDRTGGGLMAELGSHQLDAASIFISALRKDGKKAHPLAVHATGGRHLFGYDRDADDHVYCMFEFPGSGYDPSFDVGYYDDVTNWPPAKKGVPNYEEDPHKKVVVTYSSINGNGFGGYGEVVMGTKGSLVLHNEKDVALYKNGVSADTKLNVKKDADGPTMDTQASGGQTKAASLANAASQGPVSRGYTEEIEHWAYCIRNPAPENKPKCHPEVAMGDAVIALTARLAIQRSNQGKGGYIPFKEEWFDIHSDSTPENDLA
ncbi:Gfo/Idh/MocA family oxidoreductase [Bremerella alba]|uniref:Inositol 2-dehydrogenase/D-chiro-inositol 3-dehydrogenase n=1 Tax=Bremerella alba TaxID=980252 RepID=A0A7V9A709_9BACT|nr:Gfo/Idh/MocA family oxidoreductase [Bremerella alba]MBA2114848.1 Inositol 2-dehydrogenase/D-chiro-inositol 3-dehydrogenase [Bremerella alba]